MIELNGIPVYGAAMMVKQDGFKPVFRGWRERWFTRPWHPFVRWRRVPNMVPDNQIIYFPGRGYFAHPSVVERLAVEIERNPALGEVVE